MKLHVSFAVLPNVHKHTLYIPYWLTARHCTSAVPGVNWCVTFPWAWPWSTTVLEWIIFMTDWLTDISMCVCIKSNHWPALVILMQLRIEFRLWSRSSSVSITGFPVKMMTLRCCLIRNCAGHWDDLARLRNFWLTSVLAHSTHPQYTSSFFWIQLYYCFLFGSFGNNWVDAPLRPSDRIMHLTH